MTQAGRLSIVRGQMKKARLALAFANTLAESSRQLTPAEVIEFDGLSAAILQELTDLRNNLLIQHR